MLTNRQKEVLELYTDYLLCSFNKTTATGASKVLDGDIAHDTFTRFLWWGVQKKEWWSKELWSLIKPIIRKIESENGVIIFDDTIEEKPYTDINEVNCYHFDHTTGKSVRWVNILNCMYHNEETWIPLSYEVVHKTIWCCDVVTKKEKRESTITKNELMRNMLSRIQKNQVKYKYVLADSWFSSNENMEYIKEKCKKEFIFWIKSNRKIATSQKNKREGKFIWLDQLPWQESSVHTVWLKGLNFPVLIHKQIFTNKDGSMGILYLVCSDTTLSQTEIQNIYKKRWNIEVFHKSSKQNVWLEQSPTKIVRSQLNHIFSCMYAMVKLECLSIKHQLNHFALRAKVYISAAQLAYKEILKLKSCQW